MLREAWYEAAESVGNGIPARLRRGWFSEQSGDPAVMGIVSLGVVAGSCPQALQRKRATGRQLAIGR